jgi:hypothetical protein
MWFFQYSEVRKTLKTRKKRSKGRGNQEEQRRRRRERLKNLPPKTENLYRCIDGNYTNHPAGWCYWYHGALAQGHIDTHRCDKRQCKRFRKDYPFE